MILLFWENRNGGLSKIELIDCLSQNEPEWQVPRYLRKTYGNFGYRYTLSRTFDEVMAILVDKKWVQKRKNTKFQLTPAGLKQLQSKITQDHAVRYHIAAYGVIEGKDILARLCGESGSERAQI